MQVKVKLPFWKKGMKIECPKCHKKIKEPYICKCGTELKPYIKMDIKNEYKT